jgi:hypothetical protein
MPHTRTDIELDDEVLRALPGSQYKILRYLVNRADPRGVCYPGNEKIAQGVNYDLRHIERLVPELVDAGLVAYLRRKEFDPYTRRPIPNVYQINPAYICIAEAHQAEAAALWEQATGGNTRLLSRTITNNKNQPQQPAPDKPAPRTNNNNQPARAASNPKGQDAPELPDDPTAAHETDKTQDAPPNTSAQRTAKHTSPGVPPAAKFVNPLAIAETLPDKQHETMALRLRGLGIPMAMARGFVCEYGVKQCEDAMLQTLAADKGIDDGVRNHAGFFRSVLQQGLADRKTFKAHEDDQEAGY